MWIFGSLNKAPSLNLVVEVQFIALLEIGQDNIRLSMSSDKYFSHLYLPPSFFLLNWYLSSLILGLSLPSSRKTSLINPIFLIISFSLL